MSYIVVENFSGGMDNSRPIYAGSIGTLWDGVNGHISRGGDFEKRKKFTQFVVVSDEKTTSNWQFNPNIPEDAPYGTIDILKFLGHAYDAVGLIAYVNENMDAPVPVASMRYVVIRHPIEIWSMANGNPISIFPKALEMIDFEMYNGKTFAVFKFDTGELIPYYDGQPVMDFVEGINYLGKNAPMHPALSPVAFFFKQEIERLKGNKLPSEITASVLSTGPDGEKTLTISGFATSAGTNTGLKVYQFDTTTGIETEVTTTYASGTTTNAFSTVTITFRNEDDAPNGAYKHGRYRYTLAFRNVLGGGSLNIGLRAKPSQVGSFIKTYGRKVYMVSDSILDFSGVDDATLFDRDDDAGAGFINISNQTSGSEKLAAVEAYQDKMAAFSRGNIQIWYVDADPAKNVPTQNLNNTGTRSPKSVASYGDIDVFYLSDTGIRSIRARDSTNSAAVNDVGTPIDTYLQEHLRSLESAVVEAATAVVEPIDGRYMLAVGRKIFVFSYFPSKKISGWSYYDVDFDINNFFVRDGRVYCVSGRSIYLLGGESGQEYGDDYDVIAQLPFISARKPATNKQIKGVDIVATGSWDYKLLTNPNNITEYVDYGVLENVTTFEADISGGGFFTHVAPRLVHRGAGYASISSVIVHFEGGKEE